MTQCNGEIGSPMAKLRTLDAMEKWRALKYVMEKLGALDGAVNNFGPLGLDTVGKLWILDDAMGKLGPLDDLIGDPGPRIIFKQVNAAP